MKNVDSHPMIEPSADEKRWANSLTASEIADLVASCRELRDAALEHFEREGKEGLRPSRRLLEAFDRADLAMGIELDDGKPEDDPNSEG